MSCVYALVLASAPDDYRYIGRTSYPVNRRLSDHWSQARSGRNTHQYKWMRKALLDGEVVQVVVLEDGLSHEESVEREIYFIKEFREKGHRLTNATDGGEGVLGQVVSLETRERLRQANLGNKLSPETRAKISDALKGRKQSKEHVEKSRQVRIGHAVSPETRIKIGLAGRGRKASIETRKKISEANKKAWDIKRAKDT